MSWIKGNRYLSEYEKQNNAAIVYTKLTARGWSVNAIAGLLGNMESESTINPGIWQSLDENNYNMGYGLVQWTPATNYTNWATANGYEIDDGDGQLVWLDEVTVNFGQWIPTTAYDFSFYEFKKSTESPEYLASAFLKNFERAGVEVEEERRTQARKWYEYINAGLIEFIPRLTSDGIRGDFHYYSKNPFYLSGYGMPNCTCYAWARFWEIGDPNDEGINKPSLPLGNAGTWVDEVVGYSVGDTPQLGAVICWKKPGEAGHVAIVEEIKENGDIVTSNSGWNSSFFYVKEIEKANGYNFGVYEFQGFIYNPFVGIPGEPGNNKPIIKKKKKKYKFFIFE